MNLDELQSVRSRERQTDSLQQLRDDFYRDVAGFVADLREQRDRAAERAEDPFDSPEVSRLSDDIDTAEGTVEAIYERRVGKIVKMASLAAADMPTDDEGLTAEERELFDRLVGAIRQNRSHVLDVLDGEIPADAGGGGGEPAAGAGGESAADAMSDPVSGRAGEPAAATGDPTEPSPDRSGGSDPEPAGPDPASDPGDGGVSEPPGAAGIDVGAAMGGGDDGRADERDVGRAGADAGGPPVGADDPGPRESEPAGRAERGDDGSGPGSGGSEPPVGRAEDADDERPPEEAARVAHSRTEPDGGTGLAGTDDAPADGEPGDPADGIDLAGDGGDPAAGSADVERETVRITADVAPILGVDQREYDLSTDDVVQLPAKNVGPLVERDAAERLE